MTCTLAERTYHDGEWSVWIRKASGGGIAQLKQSFEQPDRFDARTTVCAAVLIVGAPVLFLDHRGHVLVARYPSEHPCGQPLGSVMRSVAKHTWTVVATVKARQQFTAKELAAGCYAQVKDMVSIDVQAGTGLSRGGPVFTHDPHGLLNACIYRVTGGQPALGSFVRGIHFNAHQSAQLRAALTGTGRLGPCPSENTFAYILTKGANDSVFLELGGCWRLQRDQAHITLGSATDPALLARLLGTNHVP